MNSVIKDITKSFSNEITASVSLERMATALVLSFALALMVAIVYRITYKGVSFQKSFARGLILLAMITSAVIMAISTNLVLSLGMVGALSIVRFRTAVKEPLDTIFMFWSIAIGLMCGAGLIFTSIIVNVVISVIFVLISFFGEKSAKETYLLVIRYSADNKALVDEAVKSFPKYKVRSKIANEKGIELAIEMKISKDDILDLDRLREIDGVTEVNAVAYNGSTVL